MKYGSVGYDVVGNIVILKFSRDAKSSGKKRFAEKFLREHTAVLTILEKTGKFSGRLRTLKTKHLAGERTKEALYKENGCVFRFNVETCYFSPRLSSERKEIAEKVKKNERVLVMFGGVAPFAIVIAKDVLRKLKLKGPKSVSDNRKSEKVIEVVSVELGRECNKYAEINVRRNKLFDSVKIMPGDVRKKVPLLKGKFDRIVMARPNLKDSFLDVAFRKIAKHGTVHYYGFYKGDEKDKLGELIKSEAKKARKKIKIIEIKKAGGGGIGPYKFRFRADFNVLN